MLQRIRRLSFQSADIMGISASILCMIHCLAIPVMISIGFIFSPVDSHTHEHDHGHFDWHWVDFIFVAFAILAVANAAKSTQSKSIKIALWVAVSIFSIGVMLHDVFNWMLYISLTASIALVIIHIINWKFHRKCKVNIK